jgi:peroxiredoxin
MKRILMFLCATALIFAQRAPQRAPGFCLVDTTGEWRDLYDYRGKVVVIEFMQTSCPHCAAFVPKLSAIAQKYAGKVQVLSIALPPDNPKTMADFVNGHQITYPLLLDMGQVAGSYVRVPNLRFPHLYLVDADGMIRGNWEEGPLNREIFEGSGLSREIDKLVGSAAPAPPAAKKK